MFYRAPALHALRAISSESNLLSKDLMLNVRIFTSAALLSLGVAPAFAQGGFGSRVAAGSGAVYIAEPNNIARSGLVQVPEGVGVPPPNWRVVDKVNQAYVWVDDVDALYDELRGRGAPIDFTIYDTPWGTREFGIQDLDEHDIAFGQPL